MTRKQSSSRVSRLAAVVLGELKGGSMRLARVDPRSGLFVDRGDWSVEVRSLCASVLSQDETRGQAKPKKRRRK